MAVFSAAMIVLGGLSALTLGVMREVERGRRLKGHCLICECSVGPGESYCEECRDTMQW